MFRCSENLKKEKKEKKLLLCPYTSKRVFILVAKQDQTPILIHFNIPIFIDKCSDAILYFLHLSWSAWFISRSDAVLYFFQLSWSAWFISREA